MLKRIYHYLLILRSGFFDRAYYLKTYPDVSKADVDPLWHFIRFGWREGRNPSESFATNFYLQTYPDVEREGVNPLVHYIKSGKKEGRKINASQVENPYLQNYLDQFSAARDEDGSEYVPDLEHDIPLENPEVKLISFYLPQFHPIPENDMWWGKGFTEWTNVSKAIPQYLGHYQPRLPGELGYYDLRIPNVMHRQIELAKKYGIHGFCFHYYWFGGKRLLEKPLNSFLDDPDMDFPFCICWANENWTRRWDGHEFEILIPQKHNLENDKRFIEDLEPVLRDPRYIKINERPLIIIYRPTLLEDPHRTAEYWREYCTDKGLGDPIITSAQVAGHRDPTSIGFEATVEFPPNNLNIQHINQKMKILNPDYHGVIYDYREVVSRKTVPLEKGFRTFRTVMPSWDNEPRRPGRGHTYAFATPERYARWLEQVCLEEIEQQPLEERMVFINAWNEWAESAYLEPDRKYGYAYLNATRKVLERLKQYAFITKNGERTLTPTRKNKTAVILHIYYMDLFPEIVSLLEVLKNKFDVFISMPETHESFTDTIFDAFPDAYVYLSENRGRDIAPFIDIYRIIAHLGYSYLLKLHTKKSMHRKDGDVWRHDIFEKLLGSEENIQKINEALSENNNVGIIGPKKHVINNKFYWGANIALTQKFADDLNIPFTEDIDFYFIAGTMFWATPEALSFIIQLPISRTDFEPEPIPPDGTLAHAMERIIGLSIKSSNLQLAEIDKEGKITLPNKNDQYPFADF